MKSASQQFALEAQHLSICLAGREVVHGVSLTLPKGQWVSLVGPNGAGKSTLLKALAGLIEFEGRVVLLGQPWSDWTRRARAQRMAWLGQAEPGQDDLTVYDVAMLGRLPHQAWLASPSPKDRQVVEVALRTVQAWDWRSRSLGQLSGGERQRVLLARALAVQADVLLMDEPLAGVDLPHQADWLEWVRCLTVQGTSVVSVLHELNLALQADRLWVMSQGLLVHDGLPHEADTHNALSQVFENRLHWQQMAGQDLKNRWIVTLR